MKNSFIKASAVKLGSIVLACVWAAKASAIVIAPGAPTAPAPGTPIMPENKGSYLFEDGDASTGGYGGNVLKSISGFWNGHKNILSWETELTSTDVNSFWLVVNDGPNPKQLDTNQGVIMYGDLTNNTVTSYVYNGKNSADSWYSPGIYLQTDELTVDGLKINFSIDATDINSEAVIGGAYGDEFKGISFGPDYIGVWYHLGQGDGFTYNENDHITSYRHGIQSWYDRANLQVTSVPEPGSLALLALGMIGLIVSRRKTA